MLTATYTSNAEMQCARRAAKAELVVHGCGRQRNPRNRSTISRQPAASSRASTTWTRRIDSFARSCFNYALDTKQDLWFATKDTISKTVRPPLQGHLRRKSYDKEYKEKFEAAGIEYFYTLIDDAVARVIRSEGGYIWACKNYDGDVMSDMVATAYGSPRHDDLASWFPRTAYMNMRQRTAPCSAITTSI